MIDLIIFCFCTATLSHFIQVTMEPGMIFRRYYLFLVWLQRKKLRKSSLKIWVKPLGTCIYCNSTWIFICTFLLFNFYIKSLPSAQFAGIALFLFLGMGLNFFFVDAIGRVINR